MANKEEQKQTRKSISLIIHCPCFQTLQGNTIHALQERRDKKLIGRTYSEKKLHNSLRLKASKRLHENTVEGGHDA